MKTNNPKTTPPDPHVDQFLTAVGRLSLVHLIKMDPAMVRDISSQAGLSDAQSSGQSVSSSRPVEPDNISSPRSAELVNQPCPLSPVRGIPLNAPFPENLRLTWTRSKIDLVELIYALRELRVFSNGEAELKAITACFEYMFSFELGNISSAFQEILERKKSYTNITDKMRDVFLKKVESSGRG
ncbi:MAG TPA: RteC domain-containing protein [Chitinophagaceae bacterium]|jgi:hypothetical protein|nr:RteC domain-containing protein [Chitinophagaceae bacterium]